MAVYNPKSMYADDFINHEEILETLEYAERNKNNLELIDSLLEKARPKKTAGGVHCAGLTHREASVLLACENPEKIAEMYRLAEEIKLAFYGNRIVMVCAALSVQLLYQRLRLLPVSCEKPSYRTQKADAG